MMENGKWKMTMGNAGDRNVQSGESTAVRDEGGGWQMPFRWGQGPEHVDGQNEKCKMRNEK